MITCSQGVSVEKLLAAAAAAGVTVVARGGLLSLKGPRAGVALIRETIGERKAEVLQALTGARAGAELLLPNAPPPEPPADPRTEEAALVAELRAPIADDWREHIESALAEALGRPDAGRRLFRLHQLIDFVRAFCRPRGNALS